MRRIDLDSPYISAKADSYVTHVLASCRKGKPGDTVLAFEKLLRDFLGVKYAFACASGTNALHVALLALNLAKGSEIITNPLTNIATISAILKCGCRPIFSGIKEDGFFDLNDLEAKITVRTRCIIPVHFGGYSESLEELLGLAKERHIPLVEDACQAFGSRVRIKGSWQFLGTWGDIGVYSFGGGKALNTLEGGMIVTQCKSTAALIARYLGLGDYSRKHVILGYNSQMDVLRGALGLANFRDFNQITAARKRLWLRYQSALSGFSWLSLPQVRQDLEFNYTSYILKIESKRVRAALLTLFKSIHYKTCMERMPLQPNAYIDHCTLDKNTWQVIDTIYSSYVALPTHPGINDEDFEKILGCFGKVQEVLHKGVAAGL